MNDNEWFTSLEKGKKGEMFTKENAIELLKPIFEMKVKKLLYDYRNFKNKQNNGIDGNINIDIEWETKARFKDYGDILLETVSVIKEKNLHIIENRRKIEEGKEGWWFYCKADVIIYLIFKKEKVIKGFLIIKELTNNKFNKISLKQHPKVIAGTPNKYNPKWLTENRSVQYEDFPEGSLINITQIINEINKNNNQSSLNLFF